MKSNVSPASGHARKDPLRRAGGFAAVLIALAAFTAACGGPGSAAIPGYVNGTPGTPMAFAQCMRAHGVPNFPDPPSSGDWNLAGVNQNSPQFQHAVGICGSSGPGSAPSQQAAAMAKGLAFSRCMRAHDVRNYPDPSASGSSVSISVQAGSGLSEKSPAFQAALRACNSVLSSGGSSNGSTG